MATAAYTGDNINFSRLSRLLIECGTIVLSDVLQNQLTRQYPSQTLETILNDEQSVKYVLSSVQAFNKQQQLLLYPTSRNKQNLGPASKTVAVPDFDITLTCLLLRNICGLKPANDTVWDNPLQTDTSLEANIAAIRICRNTIYGHRTEAGICVADFTKCWNETVQILLKLSKRYTQAEYDLLRTAPIDTALQRKYAELLELWKNRETSVTAKILTQSDNVFDVTEKTWEKVKQLPTAMACSKCFNEIIQLICQNTEKVKSHISSEMNTAASTITADLEHKLKLQSDKTREFILNYDTNLSQNYVALKTALSQAADNQALCSERVQEQYHQLHTTVIQGQQSLDESLHQVLRNQASSRTTNNDQIKSRCQHPAQRIRPRNLEFKGRKQLLQDIRQALNHGLSTVTQRQTIYGLGGVGKTELVTEFAHLNKTFYDVVRWIDADTTSLLLAFREFAEDLEIEMQGQNIDTVVRQVFRKLRSVKSWLLIYDSAPDYESIKHFLPKIDSLLETQHILVTSRSPKWKKTIPVDVFTPAEAWEYIKSQCTSRSDNEVDCRELAETLGYLPLALRQATQYIKQNRKTIRGYLQLYMENQISQLAQNFDFEDESEKTVMTTWITSEEKIREKSKDAENLLYWCAFMSPDNIPVELFEHALLLLSEIRVNEAINAAQSYSMISSLSEERRVEMHRLVQLVIRNNLVKTKDTGAIVQILTPLIQCFTGAVQHNLLFDDFRTSQKYFPHIKSLLVNIKDYISGMSDSVEYLMNATMSAMIDAMESKDALMIGEKLVKLEEERYGTDSVTASDTQHNMAIALQHLGDVRRAISIYQNIIPIYEKQYGVDSIQVCETQGNMASAMGDARGTVNIYHKIIPVYEEHFGADSVQVCEAQENMAIAIKDLGDVHRAVSIYQKVIPIYEKHYGADSVQVCQIQANMAIAINETGDHQSALDIYQQIIPFQRSHYGEEQVNTANTYINMTVALNDVGDHDAVIPILQRVSPIIQTQLGDNNIYMACIHENMAEALRQKKNPTKALTFYLKSVAMKESLVGDNHVKVAITLYKMSFCLVDLGKEQEAKDILDRAYTICVDNKCEETYPIMERIITRRRELNCL